MPKYLVETTATVRRFYAVEAANVKEAEAQSCNVEPTHEEDRDEETVSVTEQKS